MWRCGGDPVNGDTSEYLLASAAGGRCHPAGCRCCCRPSSRAQPTGAPIPRPWNAGAPRLPGRRQPAGDRRTLDEERPAAGRALRLDVDVRRRVVVVAAAGNGARSPRVRLCVARRCRPLLVHSALSTRRGTSVGTGTAHCQRSVLNHVIHQHNCKTLIKYCMHLGYIPFGYRIHCVSKMACLVFARILCKIIRNVWCILAYNISRP